MDKEVTRTHPAITPDHLRRLAVIYIRQSTLEQVRNNTGSVAFQRSLVPVAKSYGWADSQIIIIDDLGKSGSSTEGRTGWQRIQEMIDADQLGAVFAANMSRLSRRLSDFELFRLRAAHHNTVLYIDGRFLNPADANDAAVSQITAMVAQFENRKRVELMMQGKLAKAKRGEVMTRLPLGWIKRPDGRYDYDPAVKEYDRDDHQHIPPNAIAPPHRQATRPSKNHTAATMGPVPRSKPERRSAASWPQDNFGKAQSDPHASGLRGNLYIWTDPITARQRRGIGGRDRCRGRLHHEAR